MSVFLSDHMSSLQQRREREDVSKHEVHLKQLA